MLRQPQGSGLVQAFTGRLAPSSRPAREILLFGGLWLFIIAVSVHDGYLVLANRSVMMHTEQNPLGQVLIEWNRGDIWLLLFAKTSGTFLAAMSLLLLYSCRPRLAHIACVAVAVGQLILLCWLYQP